MKEKILLSGYTKHQSKGVYLVDLDTQKETLSHLREVVSVSGPTYLALDPSQSYLYTVAVDDKGRGGTAAFTFDGEHAQLINESLAPKDTNCYLAVDPERRLVYSADYHRGQVRVYKQSEEGGIVQVETIQHENQHGPRPQQDGPHCHFADLSPDGHLVVCDLGNDAIYTYQVDDSGKLTQISLYQSAPGSGNRHLVFSPDGNTAFLACELDSTVEVLAYDQGIFSLKAKLSTLPADYTGFNGTAAIRLSSDGRFLYLSNRGHDSLAIYAVTGQGLNLINIVKTEGQVPRDFIFSLSQDFLIVAHQESNNLTLFRRNQETGQLTLLQKDFYMPEGTCLFPLRS